MPNVSAAEDELIPTRRSLLSRLKDWDDQESWRDFFNIYWRLQLTRRCIMDQLRRRQPASVRSLAGGLTTPRHSYRIGLQ